MSVRLATGPVSWGVDFASAPGNPPWAEVLDGIVRAGYGGLELGPLGYLPTDAARLGRELGDRGLGVVGAFVFEPLHDPTRREDVLAAARRVVSLVGAVGGRHLVIIDLVSEARARTAGRVATAPRLDAGQRAAMLATIREVAVVAEADGLVPAVHPHAGSYVEAADEIEAVADVAPLCLDTGHLAYAGLDPVGTVARFADRLALMHLKDVERTVLARVRREPGLDFWGALAAGVFCPAGAGVVDFEALGAVLAAHGYAGWATVEQDRRAGGDPVADLVASRQALEALGTLELAGSGALR